MNLLGNQTQTFFLNNLITNQYVTDQTNDFVSDVYKPTDLDNISVSTECSNDEEPVKQTWSPFQICRFNINYSKSFFQNHEIRV